MKYKQQWAEAEIVADPVKNPVEPIVLVRRRESDLIGSRGEQLMYLDGNPAISLFTGAGGFDIGIERAGFACLCQVEWSEFPCETLIANRPDFFRHAALIQGDIRKISTGMILREAGLRVGECHLVVGGPPCQGFSTSNMGARKGVADERNDLVYEYLRFIREAKPHFFLFENVRGFTMFNQGEYLKSFLKTAHDCYYELVYGLANAVEYGVPQDRCRFLCMGTRRDLHDCDGLLGSLPPPQNFGEEDLSRLVNIQGLPLFRREYDSLKRAPGIRYFPDREVLIPPDPHGENGRSKAFLEFYKRIEQREPDRLVRQPVHC